jgi:hypothetical protein
MGVMEQVLSPGMQYGKKADTGAEVPEIPCDGQQSFRGGVKEDPVDRTLVAQGQVGNVGWHSEDDVKIGYGEEFALTLLEPFEPCGPLTLGAVAIPTGVVGDGLMAAFVTEVNVAPQDRGATGLDRVHDSHLRKGQHSSEGLPEGGTITTEHIRHLQERPGHQCLRGAWT